MVEFVSSMMLILYKEMFKALLIGLLTHTMCLQINYGVDPKRWGGGGDGLEESS